MGSLSPLALRPVYLPPYGRLRIVFLLTTLLTFAATDVTHVARPGSWFGGGLPEREPAAVGMSAERLGTIDRVVQRGVEAGGYPGAELNGMFG